MPMEPHELQHQRVDALEQQDPRGDSDQAVDVEMQVGSRCCWDKVHKGLERCKQEGREKRNIVLTM